MPVPVDIVLPCFNPNTTWHRELISFYNYARRSYALNFIVVNDGSPGNKISEQLEELKRESIPVQYISYSKNKGKGFALRKGVAVSTADFVIYTDIDFPFTDQSTLDLIACLTGNTYDIVAGYRDGNYYQKKMSGFRRALSKAFRFFIGDLLKMPVTDTQCGLKGFNKRGREKFLATTINRYLFDFEFIYTACRDKSLRIYTIQARLKDNVVFSKMKVKILVQEAFNLMYVLLFRKN
jgi:glycosyltransferase involved in cell wall biosynthesis